METSAQSKCTVQSAPQFADFPTEAQNNSSETHPTDVGKPMPSSEPAAPASSLQPTSCQNCESIDQVGGSASDDATVPLSKFLGLKRKFSQLREVSLLLLFTDKLTVRCI